MKKRIETKIKIIGNISSRTEERQYYLKQLQLSQRVFNEIHMKISRLSTVEEVFKQTYGESLQSSSTAKRLKKKYVNGAKKAGQKRGASFRAEEQMSELAKQTAYDTYWEKQLERNENAETGEKDEDAETGEKFEDDGDIFDPVDDWMHGGIEEEERR